MCVYGSELIYQMHFRPLQRMVIGMLLAGSSFVVAGFVQLKVQASEQFLKGGESKLILYNGAYPSFSYNIEGNGYDEQNLNLTDGEVSRYGTLGIRGKTKECTGQGSIGLIIFWESVYSLDWIGWDT